MLRATKLIAAALPLALVLACSKSEKPATKTEHKPSHVASGRDLAADEAHGGHTLKKHVGRSDAELAARLRSEPGISAASTYTDRRLAEEAVGSCIDENSNRISDWLQQERHPNLALECVGDPAWPVGRTLHRGEVKSEACSNETVVLKYVNPREYFVLTSYPECR